MKCWIVLLLVSLGSSLVMAQPATSPCINQLIRCFALDEDTLMKTGPLSPSVAMSRPVVMEIRASHGGVLAHHWVELKTSDGIITIGYGPASMPFIDAGQISIWDEFGNEESSGLHILPTHFNYAKPPGVGRVVGTPIELTQAQADAVLKKESHRKAIFPYIPIFHDCRTFVCTVKATADGKSTLPCYLLFKGYW
jgi:hypothetical protein